MMREKNAAKGPPPVYRLFCSTVFSERQRPSHESQGMLYSSVVVVYYDIVSGFQRGILERLETM